MLPDNQESEEMFGRFRVITEEEETAPHDELLGSGDPNALDGDFPWKKRFSGDPADERNGLRRSGIPVRKRKMANWVHSVPATYLRKIQIELETGDFDTRTVLSACQGLEYGSKEFSTKYFEARLTALLAGKARIGLPVAVGTVVPAPDVCGEGISIPVEINVGANPFIIRYPSDLFRHFGIWITALLGLEIWNSWQIGVVLDQFLKGGIPFLSFSSFFGLFLMNSALWFRCRNNLSSRFILPGGVLLVLLFALAAMLHFYNIVDIPS